MRASRSAEAVECSHVAIAGDDEGAFPSVVNAVFLQKTIASRIVASDSALYGHGFLGREGIRRTYVLETPGSVSFRARQMRVQLP